MRLESIFQKLIKKNRLSHAYLLWGRPDIVFVRRLANFLENQKWEESAVPLIDFLEILPEQSVAGKETIGIEAVRSAQKFLWRKPIKSRRRLAVINQADKLTVEAQNAILKIVEEPPSLTLIVMLVRNPELLAPPLVSRFQKVYFADKQPASAKISADGRKDVDLFLLANIRGRSDIIRDVAGDNRRLEEFVENLMAELAKDPVKNFGPLKELCYRQELMGRFNTNKRLQFEAWLESFRG